MYEVEFKVELTAEEKKQLINEFEKRGFKTEDTTPQLDLYVEAKDSQYGGYDVKRYRHEGDEYIYTEKVWEMIENTPARREEERTIASEEFERAVSDFPNALKIQKVREWFSGFDGDQPMSLTIDTVKFDHSPQERYFVEAEIGVEEIEKVKETKQKIFVFLSDLLKRDVELVESPGMFSMAYKKL